MTFGVYSINVSQMTLKNMEGEYISYSAIASLLHLTLEIQEGACGNSLKLLLKHIPITLACHKWEGIKFGATERKH